MTDWIQQHGALLQILASLLGAAVWLVYLQLLYSGHRRQRRSTIFITRGAGEGMDARCFVSNLGLEPVFVTEVLLRLGRDGETSPPARVTDRTEWAQDKGERPDGATSQGPLKSGDFLDIGSFADLARRAARRLPEDGDNDGEWTPPDRIEITVVAGASASSSIVGARRDYAVNGQGESARLRPAHIRTSQLSGLLGRRRVRRELARCV